MRFLRPVPLLVLVCCAQAEEPSTHRFDEGGLEMAAGWPKEQAPQLLVIAETPVLLEFPSTAGNPPPEVRLHRVTAARMIPLDCPASEATAEGWQWSWTPSKTRGPARYEVRFLSNPNRIVRLESRDPAWLKETLEMLGRATWNGENLSREEITALSRHGIRIESSSPARNGTGVNLQMIPSQGDAARRRVEWDGENPHLVVWQPGPSTGDVEIRAPRWWISPAALATNQGLIRFIDLFTAPPLLP